ncbi:hypothetical protein GLOIN_2v1868750 [Rhizophagus irregularis DAOM 181602=DAOM 197198]|nr:hypothetical protein GLOIN_2v1868750 [Rhizophagus irregularis DAOM 181602=DAOM 197198]
MSQIFILAFVLFATLFAVNAAPLALEKRDIRIQPCPGLPPGVVGLNVTVTPDPVPGTEETFDIKGTTKKDIVTGDFLSIAFIDDVTEQSIGDPLGEKNDGRATNNIDGDLNDMLILDTINLSWKKGNSINAPSPRRNYGATFLLNNNNIIYIGK